MAGPSLARCRETFRALLGQVGWFGLAAGLGGLSMLAIRVPAAAAVLGLTAATGLFLTASLEITGREFYVLPVVWVFAAAVGALLAAVAARGRSGRAERSSSKPRPTGMRWERVGLLATMLVVLMERPDALARLGRSAVSIELDTARDLVATLPQGAVIFTGEDDVLYPLFHLQQVDQVRPDLLVIPQGAFSSAAWRARLARQAPELAAFVARSRPVEDEEVLSRSAVTALLGAGRACVLTNPARTGVWLGRRLECRDLAFEIVGQAPRVPPIHAAGLRARGWNTPAAILTERERWLLAVYADRQRGYADWLARTGRPADAGPRLRRAASARYVAGSSGLSR